MSGYTDRAPDGSYLREPDGLGECDCPPGWKHQSHCPVVAGDAWRGVYPGMCVDPEICRGRGSCPRNYSCCE